MNEKSNAGFLAGKPAAPVEGENSGGYRAEL